MTSWRCRWFWDYVNRDVCVRVCRCIDVALSTKLMLKCISLITSIAFVFFLNCFSRALGGLSVWWMCQIVRDACALFESSSTSICTRATLGEGEWGERKRLSMPKKWLHLWINFGQILVQHLSEAQRNAHRRALCIFARSRYPVHILYVRSRWFWVMRWDP